MYVVERSLDNRRVDAWCDVRLPYEPSGESLAFRNALQEALKQLHAGDGEILSARYTSQVRGLVDAENVLLYNVGSACIRPSTALGLRFERSFHVVPPAPRAAWVPAHHHAYTVIPPATPSSVWRRRRRIAWWPEVPIDADTIMSAGRAWALLRRTMRNEVSCLSSEVPFALDLRVHGRVAPASILKPLFDGAVSALHAHDGSHLGEVSHRLARTTGHTFHDVRALLAGDAPLGPRRLVVLRGDDVTWNPEDERCVLGELVAPAREEALSVTGEVWEVEQARPPGGQATAAANAA